MLYVYETSWRALAKDLVLVLYVKCLLHFSDERKFSEQTSTVPQIGKTATPFFFDGVNTKCQNSVALAAQSMAFPMSSLFSANTSNSVFKIKSVPEIRYWTMGVVRLSLAVFIVSVLVSSALVSASAERTVPKKKGTKTKSFRLRRNQNPHSPRFSRSHSPSTSVENEAWGTEASDARELNIFLRNAASLIFDDSVMSIDYSMSMPTMAPAVVRPAINGHSEDVLNLTTSSPTTSDAKDNGNFETPEPIPLPTQPAVCTPLDSLPGNGDIALNISVTFELTIENNASLSQVLESFEFSLQEILASSLAGCGTNDSRRLGNLFHRSGRSLVITAVDSLGVAEMPRVGKHAAGRKCHFRHRVLWSYKNVCHFPHECHLLLFYLCTLSLSI